MARNVERKATATVTVSLAKEQLERIDARARARGCSRSEELRTMIDHPEAEDPRVTVARYENETARLKLATAQANAYAREQTRRAQTTRANMRQIMAAEANATKIALARIARGQAVEAPLRSPPAAASPAPEASEPEEPAAE
jgi:hypothetical protein